MKTKLVLAAVLLIGLNLQAKNITSLKPTNNENVPYNKNLTINEVSQSNLANFVAKAKNKKILISTDENEDGKLQLDNYLDFRKKSEINLDISRVIDLGCGKISKAYRQSIIKAHKNEMSLKLKNEIKNTENTTCVFKEPFDDGSAFFVGYIANESDIFSKVLIIGFDD